MERGEPKLGGEGGRGEEEGGEGDLSSPWLIKNTAQPSTEYSTVQYEYSSVQNTRIYQSSLCL